MRPLNAFIHLLISSSFFVHVASAYEYPEPTYTYGTYRKLDDSDGWQVLADHHILSIESQADSGTGFILASPKKNVYYIATAKHVVEGTGPLEDVIVKDNRGNSHNIKGANIIYMDPTHDIAIIKMKTDKCYFPIALGETINNIDPNNPYSAAFGGVIDQRVKVTGFALIDPMVSDFPIQRFSTGELNIRLGRGRGKNGYEIGYSAPTSRQMSGSPVFLLLTSNNAGPLLVGAMHGMGERDSVRSDSKSGFNFGIPSIHIYNAALESGLTKDDLVNTFVFTQNYMNQGFTQDASAYTRRITGLHRENVELLCKVTSGRMNAQHGYR